MPTDQEYSLTELATLAGVTPRTVRYYISLGLLPSPAQAGPGTRYGDGHLSRVRLIRKLQAEHLPLAEIRARMEDLDDPSVEQALEAPSTRSAESALDYIRGLRGAAPSPARAGRSALSAITMAPVPGAVPAHGSPAEPRAPERPQWPERSQWERVALGPNVELSIRRPLSRLENKRVERLLTIARELLEEDTP